ncbi:hypothetical protein QEN19_000079 [Hanseniaspora menglaensis]
MQIKNLILTTLLAIEGVSASHKHSKSSSSEVATSVVSTKKTSSTVITSSSTSSTSTHNAYVPGDNWKTLTPNNTYQCGFTDVYSSFGVAVKTVSLNVSSSNNEITSVNEKRDLIAPTQALDIVVGQVRAIAPSSGSSGIELVTTTTLTRTKTIVSTSVATLSVNTTALNETSSYNFTINGTFVNATTGNITFLGNSSLYNSTLLNNTASYLNSTHKVNTTSYNSTLTNCTAELPEFFSDVSCQSNTTLSVTLENGILKDSTGKIGSIVSSHQFQFNGPWPAAGTLLAGGWSITPDSNLALGDNDIFYECLTGEGYYDLFNEFIGSQCIPIQLEVVTLIDC